MIVGMADLRQSPHIGGGKINKSKRKEKEENNSINLIFLLLLTLSIVGKSHLTGHPYNYDRRRFSLPLCQI